MGKVYEDDFGTAIDLDVGEDVSAASTLRIYYTKPDGTTSFWTATLQGTSVLRYVTQSGNIDAAGIWLLQAYVTTAAGNWRGETARLRVYAAFT